MTAAELMYYLKGFAEPASEPPTREQWGVLRAHILSAGATSPMPMFGGHVPPEIEEALRKKCAGCLPSDPHVPKTSLDHGKI